MFKLSLAFSAALVSGVTVQTYCAALATQCPGHSLNAANCETAMGPTPAGVAANEVNVDTLECRYKFLVNSAFNGTNACQYAGPTGGGLCGRVIDTTCRVASDICIPGGSAAYASVADCKTGLDAKQHFWGNKYGADAAAEDSLECRTYHAVASILTGDQVHCGHYTNNGTSPCNQRISPNPSLYCEVLQRSCGNGTENPNVQQFAINGQCNIVAASYPTSSSDDARPSNGNHSLGCRQYHAWAAAADPTVHCEHAGPSGAGVCGNRREAWASILNAAPCSDPHVDLFVKGLNSTLVDQFIPVGAVSGKSYSTTFDTDKNTQICRIYHLGVASLLPYGPTGHCIHGAVSGGNACGQIVPNLCSFIKNACGFGTNASWQFADQAACETALATGGTANITAGVPKPLDTGFNTLECRFYHAGVAATFLPGGVNAAVAGAAASNQLHCSHVLRTTVTGGCNPAAVVTKAPTAATRNSAATLSAVASVAVLFFSL